MLCRKIEDVPIKLMGSVAIKLHMGESGRGPPIPIEDVRIIFEKIRANGGRPFLIDTTVLYKSERHTQEGYLKVAKENGYGEFPIVIADDNLFIEKNGIKIAKQIVEADSLLVLSHATGHILTGYAGAMKNLGMGCVVKEGKKTVHWGTIPKHDGNRCRKCGACTKVCPRDLVSFDENMKIKIDYTYCGGCMRCIKACPAEAMFNPENGLEKSFETFAIAAKSVVTSFRKEDVMYLTVIKNITGLCDCSKTPGGPVCKDMGYLVEDGPLKIDQEAVRLITKENPRAINMETWKLFEGQAKKHF
jgi:uncharacterized Fe-S center protein